MCRFGNGLFAWLILALVVTDLASCLVGAGGGLVLEAGGMRWPGRGLGCGLYYLAASWLLGAARALGVALVTSRRRGLHLAAVILAALAAAAPELVVRDTVTVASSSRVCVISASAAVYSLYTAARLGLRHVLPASLALCSLARARPPVPSSCECSIVDTDSVCSHADRCLLGVTK